MKYLVLVGTHYVGAVTDEETGEVTVEAHNENVFAKIELKDIVKVTKDWDGITVITIDGKTTKYEHIDEMYFNQTFNLCT